VIQCTADKDMSEPENSVAGIDYLCWIGTIAVLIIYVVVSYL
jgi:hypothetical protein